MKSLIIGLAIASSSIGFAAQVGQTFDQLTAEKGKPKSEIIAGTVRIVTYPDATIKLKDNLIVAITPIKTVSSAEKAAADVPLKGASREERFAEANRIETRAVAAVQRIVNQPVTALPRTPSMHVAGYGEGWFHPGAIKPDFASVDIRKSQENSYDKFEYVSSDLNPGVVFIGNELEFNAMTKLFYTDRNVPKKKLTEREMIEVNEQYRIIAKCEQTIAELQVPAARP